MVHKKVMRKRCVFAHARARMYRMSTLLRLFQVYGRGGGAEHTNPLLRSIEKPDFKRPLWKLLMPLICDPTGT